MQLLWSIPLALIWMGMTGQSGLVPFFVGLAFGMVVVLIVSQAQAQSASPMHIGRLPSQLGAFVVYFVALLRDIFISGVDVAWRVLPREMPIKPTIYHIPVQDPMQTEAIAALSAHAITITPGSLVIDYERDAAGYIMVVHTLDGNYWTEASLNAEQAGRVQRLQQMLGHRPEEASHD